MGVALAKVACSLFMTVLAREWRGIASMRVDTSPNSLAVTPAHNLNNDETPALKNSAQIYIQVKHVTGIFLTKLNHTHISYIPSPPYKPIPMNIPSEYCQSALI